MLGPCNSNLQIRGAMTAIILSGVLRTVQVLLFTSLHLYHKRGNGGMQIPTHLISLRSSKSCELYALQMTCAQAREYLNTWYLCLPAIYTGMYNQDEGSHGRTRLFMADKDTGETIPISYCTASVWWGLTGANLPGHTPLPTGVVQCGFPTHHHSLASQVRKSRLFSIP